MNFLTIVVIAIGLAMDAFAVSVASGFAIRELRIRHALRIAVFFGVFQAVMPIIGWLAGLSLRDWIIHVDHWIAFGLLGFIGIKMIVESSRLDPTRKKTDPLKLIVLLILAVATSIDALVVGLTFAILQVSIFIPILVIGLITFCLSFTGVYIGDHFGHFFERKIEIAGGVILIGIGIKILIEHLVS
ncbi:manganese efflux pump MntP family protein [bacterium]